MLSVKGEWDGRIYGGGVGRGVLEQGANLVQRDNGLLQCKSQRKFLMQCRDGGITYTFVELAPLMETHTQWQKRMFA